MITSNFDDHVHFGSGEEMEEVVAEGRRDPTVWPGWISIESNLTLRNGITCALSMSARSDEIHGDTRIEGTQGAMAIYNDRLTVDGREIDAPRDLVAGFAAQLREFAHCVRIGDEPDPSGKNVLATMAVLEALHESLQSGRAVELAEIGIRWNA